MERGFSEIGSIIARRVLNGTIFNSGWRGRDKFSNLRFRILCLRFGRGIEMRSIFAQNVLNGTKFDTEVSLAI